MTEPLDTTKIRADEAKRYDQAKDPRIGVLCDEIDRLRAEAAAVRRSLQNALENCRIVKAEPGFFSEHVQVVSSEELDRLRGWIEKVSMALGYYYEYDGPFVPAEAEYVVEKLKTEWVRKPLDLLGPAE